MNSVITNTVEKLIRTFIAQIADYTQMIDSNTSTTKKLVAENSQIELQISALLMKKKQNEENFICRARGPMDALVP